MGIVTMHKRPLVLVLATITGLAFLSVIGLVFANGSMRKQSQKEQYEVYSSYLNSDLEDMAKSTNALVVIQNRTMRSHADAGAGLLNGIRNLLFMTRRIYRIPSASASTYRNFVLRNLWTEELQPNFALAAKYKFATVVECGNEAFDRVFPNNLGYFALSAVGFNSLHNEAYFYIEHTCGMASHGNYVFMRKIGAKWNIVEMKCTWMS